MQLRRAARAGVSLTLALGVCVVSAAALAHQQESPSPSADRSGGAARPLTAGVAVDAELAGTGAHSYSIRLEAGHLVEAVVEQEGIDVVVSVLAPDGTKLMEVDSPNGAWGPEPVRQIAAVGGLYLLEVRALEPPALPGRYRIHGVATRAASERERSGAEAQRLDLEAGQLRRSGDEREARARVLRALALRELPFPETGDATHEIAGSNAHAYRLTLDAGEFVWVTVEQRNIDLALTLVDSTGATLAQAETMPVPWGFEHMLAVAESAGEVWLEVRPFDPAAAPGGYAIRLVASRPASDSDRLRVDSFTVYAEATALQRQGKIAEAIPKMERAHELRVRALGPDHRDIANSYQSLGELYDAAERFSDAIRYGEAAVALLTRLDGADASSLINPIRNLAASYDNSGRYLDAKPHLARALALLEKHAGPEHADVAHMRWDFGHISHQAGDYPQALAYFERAAAIFKKTAGADEEYAQVVNYLGSTYLQMGDLVRAEALYLEALAILERKYGTQHGTVAGRLLNLGNIYMQIGDLAKAEAQYRRALTIWEREGGADRFENTFPLQGLAKLAVLRDDFQQADAYLQRTMAIFDVTLPPDAPHRVEALYQLAELRAKTGGFVEAETFCLKAKQLQEKRYGPVHPFIADVLVTLTGVYRMAGRIEDAASTSERALQLVEETYGPGHPKAAAALQEAAEIAWARGERQRTAALLERLEAAREAGIARNVWLGSERQKLAFLDLYAHDQDLFISHNLSFARGEARAARLAMTGLLRRKGRVLDAMAAGASAVRRRAEPDDVSLLDALDDARHHLAALTLRGSGKEGPDGYRKLVAAAAEHVESLESRLSAKYAELRYGTETPTLERIQRSIAPGTALVEFGSYRPYDAARSAYGARRYAAYVLGSRGEPRVADLGDADEMDRSVDELLTLLQDAGTSARSPASLLRDLDERLLRPVRRLAGDARHLVLSPDRQLNLVPFAALVDERGRHAVESFEISYVTSGRDLVRFRDAPPTRPVAVLFASPDYGQAEIATAATRGVSFGDVRFRSLPATTVEAHEIARLLPGATLFAGARATETSLKRTQAPTVLHVATHGFFLRRAAPLDDARGRDGGSTASAASADMVNPLLRSGLALAGANRREGGDGEDGILTALEASGLDLWGTKLVVLSACDTGLGEVRAGEGVYGLRRALVLAGAETQVMSLWSVDDRATRDLMVGYYRELLSGAGRAEAMRRVQLKMLRSPKTRHPAYWAAFIVSGDWRPLT
jgi:CHAT domain-containing protein/Flp pilus assembly protein TadD